MAKSMTAAPAFRAGKGVDSWSLAQLQIVFNQAWKLRMYKDRTYREVAQLINVDQTNWYMRSDPEISGRAPDIGIWRYDNTAQRSSINCAQGVEAYMIQRNNAWFRFEFENEEATQGEASYIDMAQKHMYRQLQRSRFYDETLLFMRSYLDFGTAIMWHEDDKADGIPIYRTLQLSRCYLLENQFYEPDVLIYEFWLSAQAAADEFGYENLPQAIQAADLNNWTQRWKFYRYVFPKGRFNLNWTSPKAYADIVVAEIDKIWEPVQVGGHDTKPFYAARYTRSFDGGPWGESAPGLLSLAAQRQLNGMIKDINRLRMRKANPPVKATMGLYGKLRRTPGDATYLPAGEDYTLERIEGELKDLYLGVAELQAQIKALYHEDFFLVMNNNIERITSSTATGVNAIQNEQAAMLSAFSSRISEDYLEPVLEDLFNTEWLSGRMPPPPHSARGKSVKIVFISPLFQMQRQALEINQKQAGLVQIGQLAQMELTTANSTVMDIVNLPQIGRNILRTYNITGNEVRTDREIALRQQGRAQAAAEAQAQQEKEIQSRTDLNRAKAVAETMKSTGGAPLPGTGAQEEAARQSQGAGVALPAGAA